MSNPAWLAQLRPASFKGVPFQVDTVDVTAGDNLVVRDYPFQDLPTVFRMGAASEEIKFSAYVIGDDYIDRREALRDAFTGQGLLIHPTAGTMRVFAAGKLRIIENPSQEGGMARFELSFIRADARRFPVAATSTARTAVEAAADAKAAAADDFGARFSLTGAPGWVSDRIIGRLGSLLDSTWERIKVASTGLGDFTSDIIESYQVLRGGLNELVTTPRSLAGQISSLFTLPADLSNVGSQGFQDAFSGLLNIGDEVPQNDFTYAVVPSSPGPTNPVMGGYGDGGFLALDSAARRRLAELNGVIDRLMETLATAAYVEAIAAAELDSYERALALRRTIYGKCTDLLGQASLLAPAPVATGTSYHDAVQALLTRALADLQGRSFDAARLTEFVPQAWMPIWVVSHRLYGTTEWADEIMAMNPHITHPLLVPPGLPLRVVRH